MRDLARTCVVAILIAALLEVPVLAAPSKPLGLVIFAENAKLGDALVVGGSTVYAGDSLATENGGILRLRIGSGQFYLLSSSAATLVDAPNGVIGSLARGTAGFASAGPGSIELHTLLANVRPKTAQPTHGRVTVVNQDELVVTCYQGSLQVESEGDLYTIAEGTSYRLVSEPYPQEPAGVHRRPARRRRTALILVGTVALIGLTAWGIHELVESPDKP